MVSIVLKEYEGLFIGRFIPLFVGELCIPWLTTFDSPFQDWPVDCAQTATREPELISREP